MNWIQKKNHEKQKILNYKSDLQGGKFLKSIENFSKLKYPEVFHDLLDSFFAWCICNFYI